MARIGDFVDAVEPVSPDTPGSVVLDRFQHELNTLAIAAVDPDGRPLALIERNAFTLTMRPSSAGPCVPAARSPA